MNQSVTASVVHVWLCLLFILRLTNGNDEVEVGALLIPYRNCNENSKKPVQ